MDNNERMTTWCRMWSKDPTLARELMTEDCRQWSGQTSGLDPVVGPDEAIGFMDAYREQHVNVFTPRVLVDAGGTFAYLWDVATPDGRVHTGLDVNILRGNAVADNWIFVSGARDGRPEPAAAPGDPAVLVALAEAAVAEHGGQLHRTPVVDAVRGRVAVLWSREAADGSTTGAVDLLATRDGQVTHAWSLTGIRPFAY